jgi:hypothetical protein
LLYLGFQALIVRNCLETEKLNTDLHRWDGFKGKAKQRRNTGIRPLPLRQAQSQGQDDDVKQKDKEKLSTAGLKQI